MRHETRPFFAVSRGAHRRSDPNLLVCGDIHAFDAHAPADARREGGLGRGLRQLEPKPHSSSWS